MPHLDDAVRDIREVVSTRTPRGGSGYCAHEECCLGGSDQFVAVGGDDGLVGVEVVAG